MNSQLVSISPESEVAVGNVNGNLTLVFYASGQVNFVVDELCCDSEFRFRGGWGRLDL